MSLETSEFTQVTATLQCDALRVTAAGNLNEIIEANAVAVSINFGAIGPNATATSNATLSGVAVGSNQTFQVGTPTVVPDHVIVSARPVGASSVRIAAHNTSTATVTLSTATYVAGFFEWI
tara:strand:+ start:94 stop:456 length:363 start_codon:yes stop_codon:yes gene_type:complete